MSKTPVILKKNDSRPAVHTPIQPKILTKSSNKENAPSVIQKKILEHPEGPAPPQLMKSCQRLMSHFQIDQKLLDYLDNDNTDFLVVGVIGTQSVGKSVIANIIASANYLKINDEGKSVEFVKKHEVFPTNGGSHEGNTIDMFISLDRIIFLDTSPLLSQKRDMIVSECDDLKTLIMLFQLCHLVLVVHDGIPKTSVIRLIKVAEQMIPNHMKHRPTFAYIGNRIQPGTKITEMDKRLHDGANLTVPNLLHPGIFMHCDIHQAIQSVQERVFMSGRRSMMDSEEEIFTEKLWGQRLLTVVEKMKNDYFLRKYEALREKFHQPIE